MPIAAQVAALRAVRNLSVTFIVCSTEGSTLSVSPQAAAISTNRMDSLSIGWTRLSIGRSSMTPGRDLIRRIKSA